MKHLISQRKNVSFAALSLLLAAFSLLGNPVHAQSNGTAVGSPSYVAHSGFGQAITLNGTSQYATIPDPGPYDFPAGKSYTVEGFYQTTNSAGVPLITDVHFTDGSGIWIGMISGKLTASPFGDSSPTIAAGSSSADGNWHHFALVVVNGTSAALYQDGVSAATGSGTYAPKTVDAAYIGAFGAPGAVGNQWTGQIDEVRISSTARYTANFTPPSAPFAVDASTKSLYHLDGNAADAVVPAQTITADNAAWVVSPGNHNLVGTGAGSDDISIYPGYYRRINVVNATSAALTFNTATGAGNLIDYRWDNGPWNRVTEGLSVPLALYGNPQAGVTHLLEWNLSALAPTTDLWTSSPPGGSMQFTGLTLSASATVSQPPVRPKKVIVFGDSLSIGQRTLAANSGYPATDYDATLSAYFMLQDSLNAEVGICGISGLGVEYGGNTSGQNVPTFPSTYGFVYSGVPRSFGGANQYDLAIGCLGQNDFGQPTSGWLTAMNSAVAGIGAKKTLIMGDENGYFAAQEQQVTGAVYGVPGAVITNTSSATATADTYDGTHATAAAQKGKMLPAITAAAQPLLSPAGSAGSSTVTYLTPALTHNLSLQPVLAWPADSTATGYKVMRSTDGINYTVIATLAAGVLTYTDAARPIGGTCHYLVETTH